MATMTIRNIDEALKNSLRLAAARNGCSMEEEVRRILRKNLLPKSSRKGLGSKIHKHFQPIGVTELSLPPRSLPRDKSDLFEE